MRKLATYSIETDHTVRLDFADGARMRVPVAKLSMYLHAPDLQRVERAVKMRRQFITRHMPRLLVGVAMAGLLTAAFVTPRSFNRLLAPTQAPAPEPSQSTATRAAQLAPAPAPKSGSPSEGSVQSAHTEATGGAIGNSSDVQNGNNGLRLGEDKGNQNPGANSQGDQATPTVTPKPNTLKDTLPLPLSLSLKLP